jgi:hypothetical protein
VTPGDTMPQIQMPGNDDHAECVVCWNETDKRCSPCGDPVCPNCGCPNGCEKALDEPLRQWLALVDCAA